MIPRRVLFVCMLLCGLCAAVVGLGAGSGSLAAVQRGESRYVSERRPVRVEGEAKREEFAAWRAEPVGKPAMSAGGLAASVPYTNPWQLQATLAGAVIKDISFPTAQVGYAAAELGQVWKTTDVGAHWARIMNLGFPYYWYGVDALDANNVVVSGFVNNNMSGVARWSRMVGPPGLRMWC